MNWEEGGEDAHLEMAYEDRFVVQDDGYEDDGSVFEPDEWEEDDEF